MKGDISECEGITDHAGQSIKSFVLTCKLWHGFHSMHKCVEDDGRGNDECAYEGALKSGIWKMCMSIKDDNLRSKCMAHLEQDGSECEGIEDEAARRDCCSVITDEEKREECLGEEEEEEEEEEESGDEGYDVKPDGCGGVGEPCCDYNWCAEEGERHIECIYRDHGGDIGYEHRCTECGKVGQPCCDQMEEAQWCENEYGCCGDELHGEHYCHSCGCSNQKCCEGDSCHGWDDVCVMDICYDSWNRKVQMGCDEHQPCSSVLERCVEGSCLQLCGNDLDCQHTSEDMVCDGNYCTNKRFVEDR
jgi:hypothetical protein